MSAATPRILVFAAAADDLKSICFILTSAGLSGELVVATTEEGCHAALEAHDLEVVIVRVSGPSSALPLAALLTKLPYVGVVLVADSWDDIVLGPYEGRTIVPVRGLATRSLFPAVEQARAGARRLDARREGLENPRMRAESFAHDFNNLLRIILASAGFALSSLEEGHPSLYALSQIEAAGMRAVDLVKRFSTSGSDRGDGLGVDLGRLVREVTGLLQVRMKAGNSIQAEAEPNLPPMHGDPVELYQLVLNLGTNATRAVERGGSIHMSVGRIDIEQGFQTRFGKLPAGTYMKLVVADSGSGMDRVTQESMFDPFFTTKKQGSGLGLAIAERIIRAHRGGVIVRSQPDLGTTVEVYLPAG